MASSNSVETTSSGLSFSGQCSPRELVSGLPADARDGTVEGKLLDFPEAPGVYASTVGSRTIDAVASEVTTSSFRIAGLRPGRYVVSAQTGYEGAAQVVDVKSGERQVLTLKAQGRGTIDGTVAHRAAVRVLDPGASIVAREVGRDRAQGHRVRDPAAALRRVLAGRHDRHAARRARRCRAPRALAPGRFRRSGQGVQPLVDARAVRRVHRADAARVPDAARDPALRHAARARVHRRAAHRAQVRLQDTPQSRKRRRTCASRRCPASRRRSTGRTSGACRSPAASARCGCS